MATYSVNVTQSKTLFPDNTSIGTSTVFAVTNSLAGASYFSLETIPNNLGVYTSIVPSISGSFTYDSGIINLVADNYKMSAVVKPGGGVITFIPAVPLTASTLWMRGTS
jgi:hypothetical protein